MQCATIYGGGAAVSIPARQRQRVSVQLDQLSRPADRSTKGVIVGAIEGQNAVIADVAGNAATRSAVTNLKGSRANGRAAGIPVVSG